MCFLIYYNNILLYYTKVLWVKVVLDNLNYISLRIVREINFIIKISKTFNEGHLFDIPKYYYISVL